jgi:hypothetical protein
MAELNPQKRQELSDLTLALPIVGLDPSTLVPGEDPPDFVLTVGGTAVPIEHTRLYLEDSGTSPQAMGNLWQKLVRKLLNLHIPVEMEFWFIAPGGRPSVPSSALHDSFANAVAALLTPIPPGERYYESGDLPAALRPYLLGLTARPGPISVVSGNPDAAFLPVAETELLRARIADKISRIGSRLAGAWLFVILGSDIAQPLLGAHGPEADLPDIDLSGTAFDRIYAVDLLSEVGFVLLAGSWRRAV